MNVKIEPSSTLTGEGEGTIRCTNPQCLLEHQVKTKFYAEPVDVYGDFIDEYYHGVESKPLETE